MSAGPGRGTLVLVATPIGNLGDLSPRAKEVLGAADVVCCEDTRRTRALLSASGLPASPARLVSLHAHNEAARIGQVLSWLAEGKTVALATDAGTPAISDPGQRLVAAAAGAGVAVTAVPGPSAVLAAVSVSGLDSVRFCVEGFVPRKGTERRRRLAALAAEERTTVLFEAPSRVAQLLADLQATCGDRPVVVCRELTKLHEEIWRGRLALAAEAFAGRDLRGEVAIVLGGAPAPAPPDDETLAASLDARLAGGDTPSRAADSVSASLGVPRRRAYAMALIRRDLARERAGPAIPPGARQGRR